MFLWSFLSDSASCKFSCIQSKSRNQLRKNVFSAYLNVVTSVVGIDGAAAESFNILLQTCLGSQPAWADTASHASAHTKKMVRGALKSKRNSSIQEIEV